LTAAVQMCVLTWIATNKLENVPDSNNAARFKVIQDHDDRVVEMTPATPLLHCFFVPGEVGNAHSTIARSCIIRSSICLISRRRAGIIPCKHRIAKFPGKCGHKIEATMLVSYHSDTELSRLSLEGRRKTASGFGCTGSSVTSTRTVGRARLTS
jgi:hypothetical protein